MWSYDIVHGAGGGILGRGNRSVVVVVGEKEGWMGGGFGGLCCVK